MHPSLVLLFLISIILILIMIICFICLNRTRKKEEEEFMKQVQYQTQAVARQQQQKQQQQMVAIASLQTPKLVQSPSIDNFDPSMIDRQMIYQHHHQQPQQQPQYPQHSQHQHSHQNSRNLPQTQAILDYNSSTTNNGGRSTYQTATSSVVAPGTRGPVGPRPDMTQQINSSIIGSSEAEFQNDFIQVFPMYQIAPQPEKNTTPYLT